MDHPVNEGAETPKTPPVVWILALLVIGAVYFFWSGSRREDTSDLHAWNTQRLAHDDVAEILTRPNPARDRLGHALVQFQRHATADAEMRSIFAPLVEHLARHAGHQDATIRSLVAMAATCHDSPGSLDVLGSLLEDEDAKVTLNAAIGLAARGDARGADRLESALRGTRMEQVAARRDLLHAFRRVAQKRHVEFLENELHRAELDRDEVAAGYCREALNRLR